MLDIDPGVKQYLSELADRYGVSREREQALGQIIAAGRGPGATEVEREAGRQAVNELTECNLALVVSIAKRHIGHGVEFADLLQAGNLGLWHAAQKFDYVKGWKFSTYATWWVKQHVMRAIHDTARTIRLPVHVSEANATIHRTAQRLMQAGETAPTDERLATEAGVALYKIRLANEPAHMIRLDQVYSDSDDTPLSEHIEDPSGADDPELLAEQADQEAQVNALLACLDNRDRLVIEHRFGLNGREQLTLEQLGSKLGLTRERIRQLERMALFRLRRQCTWEQWKHLQVYAGEG